MHKKKFYSVFGNDDNRGQDGKNLRIRFKEESSFIDYSCLDGECSFLEFMLGICVRMAFIEEETDDLTAVSKYFHELLNNCGLSEATDDNYYTSEFNYEYALVVMDRILERRYAPDGKGGFFPLYSVNIPDQRQVEVWYQMCQYIEEREDVRC